MASSTMYVTIPKERVARILTDYKGSYKVVNDEDGEIVIQSVGFPTAHIATLTDYELPQARIESSEANVEAGTVGAKVDYPKTKYTHSSKNTKCKSKPIRARKPLTTS